jgi:hypothetical protein
VFGLFRRPTSLALTEAVKRAIALIRGETGATANPTAIHTPMSGQAS